MYVAVYLIPKLDWRQGMNSKRHVLIRSVASPPYLLSGLQVLGTKHFSTAHLPVCCVTVKAKVLRLKGLPLHYKYFKALPPTYHTECHP